MKLVDFFKFKQDKTPYLLQAMLRAFLFLTLILNTNYAFSAKNIPKENTNVEENVESKYRSSDSYLKNFEFLKNLSENDSSICLSKPEVIHDNSSNHTEYINCMKFVMNARKRMLVVDFSDLAYNQAVIDISASYTHLKTPIRPDYFAKTDKEEIIVADDTFTEKKPRLKYATKLLDSKTLESVETELFNGSIAFDGNTIHADEFNDYLASVKAVNAASCTQSLPNNPSYYDQYNNQKCMLEFAHNGSNNPDYINYANNSFSKNNNAETLYKKTVRRGMWAKDPASIVTTPEEKMPYKVLGGQNNLAIYNKKAKEDNHIYKNRSLSILGTNNFPNSGEPANFNGKNFNENSRENQFSDNSAQLFTHNSEKEISVNRSYIGTFNNSTDEIVLSFVPYKELFSRNDAMICSKTRAPACEDTIRNYKTCYNKMAFDITSIHTEHKLRCYVRQNLIPKDVRFVVIKNYKVKRDDLFGVCMHFANKQLRMQEFQMRGDCLVGLRSAGIRDYI